MSATPRTTYTKAHEMGRVTFCGTLAEVDDIDADGARFNQALQFITDGIGRGQVSLHSVM
jgi:hypothetical protein